jgi:hypothetical protein
MIYRKCSRKRALSARPMVEFKVVDMALCIRPALVSVGAGRNNVLRISDAGSTRDGGANDGMGASPFSLLPSDASTLLMSSPRVVSR